MTNATAIGANALVSASNALVLGSINGVNGAASGVNVGIGTATPLAPLTVGNIGNWDVASGWGDFSLTNGTVGFSIGVATGGGGTGDVRLFSKGGTERLFFGGPTNGETLTIASGKVGIGNLAPDAKLDVIAAGTQIGVRGTTTNTSGYGVLGAAEDGSGVNYGVWGQSASTLGTGVFGNATAESGSTAGVQGISASISGYGVYGSGGAYGVYSEGNAHVQGNLSYSGTLANTSSRRFKTNIQQMQGALSQVERLRGVSFDWKENGKHTIGLIAEEVGEVVPEVVTYEENGVDAKGVDYARLTAVLIEAVKEQQAQIRQLQSEMEGLKVRLGVEVSQAVASDK
ncbi:MAG: hypothetical protein A3H27_09190 [Acidobacteria bacterium RIFCSPLOWO2_02_FULL_59_13]|nr:MAG: hypothetical protein A3H27_09190 [Acidobacteria bacterium RIFCSPLOWO2_02_FULL_59_13]